MKKEKKVLCGPIQARGYSDIQLLVDHVAFLPDGVELKIPAGTKLVMTCRMAEGDGGDTVLYNDATVESADWVPPTPSA